MNHKITSSPKTYTLKNFQLNSTVRFPANSQFVPKHTLFIIFLNTKIIQKLKRNYMLTLSKEQP